MAFLSSFCDRRIKEAIKKNMYKAESERGISCEKFGYCCIQFVALLSLMNETKITLSEFLSSAEREMAENLERIGLEIYKSLE